MCFFLYFYTSKHILKFENIILEKPVDVVWVLSQYYFPMWNKVGYLNRTNIFKAHPIKSVLNRWYCRVLQGGEDLLLWDCCVWRTPDCASCLTAGVPCPSHPPPTQVDAARSLAAHSATYSPLTAVSHSSFGHRLDKLSKILIIIITT